MYDLRYHHLGSQLPLKANKLSISSRRRVAAVPSTALDKACCLYRGKAANVHNMGTPKNTCLLYFPLRLMSNSVKPFRSRSAAAVIGLSCSDRVKSDVQSENISGGTEVNLQQQQQIKAAQNAFASDKSLTPSPCCGLLQPSQKASFRHNPNTER